MSGITLKEEEVVLQILKQVGSKETPLDEELLSIIQQGEQEQQTNFRIIAEQRMLQNRQGINFDQIQYSYTVDKVQQETLPEPPLPQPSQLELFQQQTLKKTKKTQAEIMQLDREFPKLNYTSMIGKQQQIFSMRAPEATKWLKGKRLQVKIATVAIIGQKKWLIVGVQNQLVIFKGIGQKQPTIMALNGRIGALSMTPCKKYIVAGVGRQINIIEIRKNQNLVLFKNISDLKAWNIVKVICYEGNSPKICFVDQRGATGVVILDVGLILTKVKVSAIIHRLRRVDSIDAVRIDSNNAIAVVGGAGSFQIVKIEETVENYQKVEVSDRVYCSWRKQKDRISLIIGTDNRMIIYKLVYQPQEDVYCVEQHLLFLNHYPIQMMCKLSQYHYLLQSATNFVIVALPLIPSHVDHPDLSLSEAAIAFTMEKTEESRVVVGVEDGMLLVWNGLLECGRLRVLEEEIDDLIIQKCAFREAFSLLVLVAKGINYSFNFSYNQQSLKRLIHSAVELATSAIIPSLDSKIVLFRVGWIVQLCIECHQQEWMWIYLYPSLKERGIKENLFDMLEMFVLKGLVVSIPEDIFLQMIGYFCERGKEVIIEKLVLSNKQQYQATKLLSLLRQKEMNYLQFYLFSRAIISDQHDFYTPFIRTFSSFVKGIDHHRVEQVEENGLLCYYILSKSFQFQYVPMGQMTRDIKVHIVSQFFLQTLSKTFVRRLSEFNIALYLESYLSPFGNNEFIDILSQQEVEIMTSFKEFDVNGQIKHETNFVNAFLNYLQYCLGVQKELNLFAEFYFTILYFTKHTSKFQRIVQLLCILFQSKFYYFELRIPSCRPTVKELKEYIIDLIEEDLTKRTDRIHIKKLLAFDDKDVGHHIHRIDLNYQTALQVYFNNFRMDGIFKFISRLCKEAQNLSENTTYIKQRKKMEIHDFVLKKIGLFFRNDCKQALQICYLIGYKTQAIHDVVFKNPFLRGERIFFLTAVLDRQRREDEQFKQQYLLQHLEEVCMLPEEEMRQYLNIFYYPLDPAIKVADRKNNYLAKAILQLRSGLIKQAFDSYQRLIQNTLISSKEDERTRARVCQYLQECVHICKQFSGENLQENLWIRLFRFLSDFVASEQKYKVYLKVELQRSTQNIIQEMMNFLSTTLLINFFTAPQVPLPLFKRLPIFSQLFKVVKFDKSTMKRSMLVDRLDTLNFRKLIVKDSRIGMALRNQCDFCRGMIEEERFALGYFCGHTFHRLCNDNDNMCLTCSYESDDALFYRAIFKKNENKGQGKKPKQNRKVEICKEIFVETKNQATLQMRKKKMKIFDFQTSQKDEKLWSLDINCFRVDEIFL